MVLREKMKALVALGVLSSLTTGLYGCSATPEFVNLKIASRIELHAGCEHTVDYRGDHYHCTNKRIVWIEIPLEKRH